MSFVDEEAHALADLNREHQELFARADRAYAAATEIVTRGRVAVGKPEGLNSGVLMVVASLYTKVCKTFRAIQIVCEAGLGQDASVLARQLFETTVALAFILQRDCQRRAKMLAAHGDQRRLVLVQKAMEVEGLRERIGESELQAAEERVARWDKLIGPDVLASVRRHWSGKTLEGVARDVGMEGAYALMYRHTSAFAHGSDITQHVNVSPSGTITVKLLPGSDEIDAVLNSSIALMAMAADRFNDRFGLGEDAIVERIGAEIRDGRVQS